MEMKKAGFTLLEIIISVGILATVSILITQVLFTTTHVNTKSGLVQNIKQNGDFALDVMSRQIRASAANLTPPCAVGVTKSPSLVLQTANGDTLTYSCVSDGVAARITASTSTPCTGLCIPTTTTQYLTGSEVTLSASGAVTCDDSTLTFSCPTAAGATEPVTITFSLGQLGAVPNSYATARTSFETTVNPRN